MTRIFIILVTLLTLSNCQTIESRGQYVDDNLIARIDNTKLSKLDVENLIGTPTIIPSYSNNNWYYIQRSLSRRAWIAPKVIEQRIVKVSFDRNDRVREVLVLNDSHTEDINVISEYTKTYGTESNGLQRFVRNIGKFNKSKDKVKKKKR